jgi:hypothetical protein
MATYQAAKTCMMGQAHAGRRVPGPACLLPKTIIVVTCR